MVGSASLMLAQSPAAPSQNTPSAQTPHGQVLFQSHGQSPAPDADRTPLTPEAATIPGPPITNSERSALRFTSYDLDAHVTPKSSALAVRARVTVQNAGAAPLSRLILQISSTLRWNDAMLLERSESRKLSLVQHLVETDTDHTGKASEAVIELPRSLLPGGSVALDLLYSGTVEQDSQRLTRIGASAQQADTADWDAISPAGVSLRGFGDVLWYPVAAPPIFLGEGAKLFQAIGRDKLRNQQTTARLRLSVEYTGNAPAEAYFAGRQQPFRALSDSRLGEGGGGIAVAEFALAPVGFRELTLFTAAQPEVPLAPAAGSEVAVPAAASAYSTSSGSAPQAAPVAKPVGGQPMLLVEDTSTDSLPRLSDAAEEVAPMLSDWMGPHPLSPLILLDHQGQPFEDGRLLVAPVDSLASSDALGALAHSLTHAWVQTGQPWIDDGLAQFFALQWIERQQGREAAITQLDQLTEPLGLGEPSFASAADVEKAPEGQPLIAASDEMFYRRKAAAVWWMLRDIAGNEAFRAVLTALRQPGALHGTPREQALQVEKLFENTTGKDYSWFFQDWVLRDIGLPDLSIADVTPRPLPAGPGHNSGWLVAVTVRNESAAAADVPVVVRSGTFSTTRRMRIPGFGSATERVVVETAPTEVVVNDGSTPELRSATHSRTLNIQTD